MEILPSEIDEVEHIGEMENDQVKLVRTVGGLYIAVGKPKGKNKDEVLAAGSHSAIVKYNVQKNFREFRPAMEKSEKPQDKVTSATSLLPAELKQKGYDLYRLEKSTGVDLLITKHNLDIAKINLTPENGSLKISLADGLIPEGAGKAVAAVASKQALSMGISDIEHAGKRFKAK